MKTAKKIIFITGLISATAFSCPLPEDSTRDSSSSYLHVSQCLTNDHEALDEEMAKCVIAQISKDPACLAKDESIECFEKRGQTICLAESSLGRYLITKDMVDGLNIIFQRWD